LGPQKLAPGVLELSSAPLKRDEASELLAQHHKNTPLAKLHSVPQCTQLGNFLLINRLA
jgi:hypothetical protein